MVKRYFSKALWYKSANKQLNEGTLSQLEIEDALALWVNDCEGKTEEQLKDMHLNEAWFEER